MIVLIYIIYIRDDWNVYISVFAKANVNANDSYQYLQMQIQVQIFCLSRQSNNYNGLSIGQRLDVCLQSAIMHVCSVGILLYSVTSGYRCRLYLEILVSQNKFPHLE